MPLLIRSSSPQNVFELLGKDENSATYALGWTLERSPTFAARLLGAIMGRQAPRQDSLSKLAVVLQRGGDDRGFTDLELHCQPVLHVIIEAKAGFDVPTVRQLSRYQPRLRGSVAAYQGLVSMSALPEQIASLRLPREVSGTAVKHISWGSVRALAKAARSNAAGLEEKLWLRELISHLEDYAAMKRTKDNTVYVVSLSGDRMREDGERTWIDVVVQDGCYFHPVGDTWPVQPPNYLGFRYGGELHSVHHVEGFQVVDDVSSVNPSWCVTAKPHFVYKLGPAMRPPRRLGAAGPNDTIKRSARAWCAIDTLLSGQFDQLGQARDETDRRLRVAEQSDD